MSCYISFILIKFVTHFEYISFLYISIDDSFLENKSISYIQKESNIPRIQAIAEVIPMVELSI